MLPFGKIGLCLPSKARSREPGPCEEALGVCKDSPSSLTFLDMQANFTVYKNNLEILPNKNTSLGACIAVCKLIL